MHTSGAWPELGRSGWSACSLGDLAPPSRALRHALLAPPAREEGVEGMGPVDATAMVEGLGPMGTATCVEGPGGPMDSMALSGRTWTCWPVESRRGSCSGARGQEQDPHVSLHL